MPFAPRMSLALRAISNDFPALFRFSKETSSGVNLKQKSNYCLEEKNVGFSSKSKLRLTYVDP